MSLMCVWHTHNTMAATDRNVLLHYIATYQAPLRDLQIHGLAMLMIFGVCLRMLPALFDVPPVSNRRAWIALWILNASVIGESVVFIAYRWTHNHALAALLMLPWLGLSIGCWMVAAPWKLWRTHTPTPDRSWKFVRTAYLWLGISMTMLLLLPVYQVLTKIPFSHAYYGAIRHAITVGFISLMIMGFAGKVIPTLNGLDPRTLSPLRGPFVLINLGCFLRVSTQTLTDFHPAFFDVVGLSGTLEVIALAWWGIPLARIMLAGRAGERAAAVAAERPAQVTADHRVADVVDWFPATLDVFVRFGFTPLTNSVLRRSVARLVTLSQACRLHHVDPDDLLHELNRTIGRPRLPLRRFATSPANLRWAGSREGPRWPQSSSPPQRRRRRQAESWWRRRLCWLEARPHRINDGLCAGPGVPRCRSTCGICHSGVRGTSDLTLPPTRAASGPAFPEPTGSPRRRRTSTPARRRSASIGCVAWLLLLVWPPRGRPPPLTPTHARA
jgi:hypothetical protein